MIGLHPKGPKVSREIYSKTMFSSTPVVQLGTYVAAGFQQGALRIRRRIHRLPWWNGQKVMMQPLILQEYQRNYGSIIPLLMTYTLDLWNI